MDRIFELRVVLESIWRMFIGAFISGFCRGDLRLGSALRLCLRILPFPALFIIPFFILLMRM
jgi:hypothetical protein